MILIGKIYFWHQRVLWLDENFFSNHCVDLHFCLFHVQSFFVKFWVLLILKLLLEYFDIVDLLYFIFFTVWLEEWDKSG